MTRVKKIIPPHEVLWIAAAIMSLALLLTLTSRASATPQESPFTDNEILEAIEIEFRSDDALTPDTIDVSVNQGVVTLGGETDSLLSKRQAVRATGSLKGVRSIIDEIDVAPSMRTRAEVFSDVEAAISDSYLENSVTTTVHLNDQGSLRLDGVADSFVSKSLAESAVAGIRGVTSIENNIKVQFATQRPPTDIKAEIARRFELSPYLAEGLIDTSVDGKTVSLSGSVGSVNEKELAKLLCWVAGVEDVNEDQLKVDPDQVDQRRREKFTTIHNDVTLQKAIEDTLSYDTQVRSSKIDVTAKMGAVSLFGNVSSLAAKRAAERDVLNTLGVRRVINNLKVKVPEWPGDPALTKAGNESIARDAIVSDLNIHVSSHFGKMYVSGQARSQMEKSRVETVLSNLRGVRQIVNRMEVATGRNDKPDDEILEDANRRMMWSPFIDADQISVSVDDGILTLSGTVDTWQEFKAAKRHALQSGAHRVKNKLSVRSQLSLQNKTRL